MFTYLKKYRRYFGIMALLSVIIISLFYSALKPKKTLPIYNPAMVNPELVDIFDKMLFKGKSHLKRQSGITIVTEKLTKKWEQDLDQLKRRIRDIFIRQFKLNE